VPDRLDAVNVLGGSMKQVLRHKARVAVLAVLVLAVVAFGAAAQATHGGSSGNGVGVVHSYHNDTSAPLRDLALLPAPPMSGEAHEGNMNPRIPHSHANAPDPVVQSRAAAPNMPSPILNFNGIPFPGVNCNCAPPDTNGEVGATQYVQMVNEGIQVFNKTTGVSLLGPISISSLWSGFGGLCENNGFGDPVVVYDQVANRWLVSQFAGLLPITDECIAVSTTNDATGTWNRYGFHLGSNFFDYPKIAVWPDAYYMAMNVFNASGTAFLGPQAFAFDRTAMIAGNPATFQTPGITGGANEETFLPADLDGSTLPPAGAPNTFVEWPGGTSGNNYKIRHFDVDFANPQNTTFTQVATVPAAPFTALCPTTRNCIPQPNTGTKVDAIADRLMFRLAYRNFGDHEAVVGNYTVDAGAGRAGVRWFELRNVTNGPVTKQQESTYAPNDGVHRWMGSAAMDHDGNLAVGFSASNATNVFPSLRYAGRLATDPVNTLGQGEAILFPGRGSQSDTVNRWGDYSDLTIDPSDDCTFFYTNEFYPAGVSSFNWRTRIGSFRFSQCGGGGNTGTLQGTVTDSVTSAPISGVTVKAGTTSTTTNAAGFYSMTLAPATYSVQFGKQGFVRKTINNVVVNANQTTTLNTTLTPQ
jgi:hypothetical protein